MSKNGARPKRYYISEWAKQKGQRQAHLVTATGMSESYLSLLWSDSRQPGPESLAKLADAIGVPQFLLGVHPESPIARAFAALIRMPSDRREHEVQSLEAVAATVGTKLRNGDDPGGPMRVAEVYAAPLAELADDSGNA